MVTTKNKARIEIVEIFEKNMNFLMKIYDVFPTVLVKNVREGLNESGLKF